MVKINNVSVELSMTEVKALHTAPRKLMHPLWHWINCLFGRHSCAPGVSLVHDDPTRLDVIAWSCENCGHGWIETRRTN